jgi:hypothetical protein
MTARKNLPAAASISAAEHSHRAVCVPGADVGYGRRFFRSSGSQSLLYFSVRCLGVAGGGAAGDTTK